MKSLRLRVATYNIHKGVVPGPSLRRRPMVKEMRQRLHELQADVVFLQEVQGQNNRFAKRFAQWPADPQAQYLALDPESSRRFQTFLAGQLENASGVGISEHGESLLRLFIQ